jgi:hypothetical protein
MNQDGPYPSQFPGISTHKSKGGEKNGVFHVFYILKEFHLWGFNACRPLADSGFPAATPLQRDLLSRKL